MEATEHVPYRFTLGIDIASQPGNTGVCLVEWTAGAGRVVDLDVGVGSDTKLLERMTDPSVTKIGIDAPLGWPSPLIDALVGLQADRRWPVGRSRRDLLYRSTDLHVAEEMGRLPLSVAASFLAWPALRAVDLRQQAVDARKDGDLAILEVYPAAALMRWGLVSNGISYRGSGEVASERRRVMIETVVDELGPSFSVSGEFHQRCVASDHMIDALACALVARAAECRDGLDPVPKEHEVAAREEGWIRLPASDVLQRLCRGR